MNPLILVLIGLSAWIAESISQIFLYFFPTAYGIPYMVPAFSRYMQGLFYSGMVISFISLPFVIASLFKKVKLSWLYIAETILLFIYLCVNHADQEVIRFLGNHYSIQMLKTYKPANGDVSAFVTGTLREDARGAFSSVWLYVIPIAWIGLVFGFRKKPAALVDKRLSKRSDKCRSIIKYAAAAVITIFPLSSLLAFVKTDSTYHTHYLGSSRAQYKISPFPIALIHDLRIYSDAVQNDYSKIPEQTKRLQELWLSGSTDPAWTFVEGQKPLLKRYNGTCPVPEKKPNIVVIFVESMRGLTLPDFNPNYTNHYMPFLHSLVEGNAPFLSKGEAHRAYFTHYITNGAPTIDALMAAHIGVAPHSSMTVAANFAGNKSMKAYSNYLTEHGYDTQYIDSMTGNFDSKPAWFSRWYDHVSDLLTWDDNVTLKRLEDEIIRLRKGDKPFEITTELVTNHVPFNLPGEQAKLTKDLPLAERTLLTLHYDDELLEKFFNRMAEIDAFSDTVFFVLSDHGYDFGEYAGSTRITDSYGASLPNVTWVPFFMISGLDVIPEGKSEMIASHMDIAPTIMELAGICDDNSFLGHSLLHESKRFSLYNKSGNYLINTPEYSAIFVADEEPLLFDFNDREQRTDIHKDHPDVTENLRSLGSDIRTVLDYTYENDLL